jgi:nucleotide-binding universal stress UspA family protein
MRRVRRILCATDLSRASRAAVKAALALARREGAELELLHVALPPAADLEDGFSSARTVERQAAAMEEEAERKLGALVAGAAGAGVRTSVRVRFGIPATTIAAEARRRRADLIVIGTHGRSGLPRFVLGSVAARVIATAPCPVLTVRGR